MDERDKALLEALSVLGHPEVAEIRLAMEKALEGSEWTTVDLEFLKKCGVKP